MYFLKKKERCGIPFAKERRNNCGICLLPIIPTQPKEDSSCRLFGTFPTKRINGLNSIYKFFFGGKKLQIPLKKS